ncbi:helix-turn-helix transcriptional regulator [uncultured Amnibacterium sp.]|uniref:helix-turn-helix transcriptional regulator n=1 Tax=uncultured Amnibacterium sp. TaxID=1631851 RepID=UPI0035C94C23
MADAQPVRVQDRLAFLLALVPYLLDNDGVPVAQAAAHFRVPEQRIRDAVELIAVSGVPGETKSYQPGDLFDIDWDRLEERDEIAITHQVALDDSPRFSAREAAALIAGLQYVAALPANADRETVATLTAKLTRSASSAPAAMAVEGGADTGLLVLVRDAVSTGTVMVFDYLNGRDEREERTVEPLRVESVDESWYLRAWDRSRRALRTFRLDRMRDVRTLPGSAAERPEDIELPERIFQPSKQDRSVTIDVAAAAVPLLADYLGDRPQTEPARRGWVRTRLRIAHLHGLKRLVAGRAGLIVVVEPDDARSAVREWAIAGLARYEDQSDAPQTD